MIAFDFSYYRPTTVEEAVDLFQQLTLAGNRVMYLSGGTELITRARASDLLFDAAIDIKDILPCNACQLDGDELVIGAGVTMSKVAESNLFPLLTMTLKGIADHTSRNKITIGGNICSHLKYRESVLPFLLGDSQAVIAGKDGTRQVLLKDVFDQAMHLKHGEFLVQVRTKKPFIEAPCVHIRKTKQSKIDYPLYTIALIGIYGDIRLACSGLYQFPFRFANLEKVLSDKEKPMQDRVHLVTTEIANGVVDDMLGSGAYRKFVFQQGLMEALGQMEAMME
jgi:CO/xanthine dehydrogenase FAD-binding subunit